MKVDIESPYAGEVEINLKYGRACMRDCLKRGEFPIASHLLYTQPGILDDAIPEERELGIKAGDAWGEAADLTVVYVDRGVSSGMRAGVVDAFFKGRPREYRSLFGNEDAVAQVREQLESYARSLLKDIVCP